jgi:putative membrane protein
MHRSAGFWQYSAVLGFLGLTLMNPHDVSNWFIQNSVVFVGVAILLWLWRKRVAPTPLLCWLLAVHAFILIYGAWHTYSRAPVGQLAASLFDLDRNHYDRLAHFAQGFFPTVVIREVLWRNSAVEVDQRNWREFFVFTIAVASGGVFELIEFAAAMTMGDGTAAYLGSQGDGWDAQWDMLWCGIGAIASIVLLARRHTIELAQMRMNLSA